MRLWSFHPKHLDAKGLVALWREGLLAQKVLCGKTEGYQHHPQLHRFKKHGNPKAAIASYLAEVWKESNRRGYHFNKSKILSSRTGQKIKVNKGQLHFEHQWLASKLRVRAPSAYRAIKKNTIHHHPLFKLVSGQVEDWEKQKLNNRKPIRVKQAPVSGAKVKV